MRVVSVSEMLGPGTSDCTLRLLPYSKQILITMARVSQLRPCWSCLPCFSLAR
jgi:hypothetical protein